MRTIAGMKAKITSTLLLLLAALTAAHAQTEPGHHYRNFPIIVTLQFHAFTVPFHDLKTHFQDTGLGIGTEISYNGKNNWVQQVSLVWYGNKAMGNGLMVFSQVAWRPGMSPGFFGELKAGAGYLYAFRPNAYRQVDGVWIPAGRKGRGMLVLPAGVSAGYDAYAQQAYASPFVSYQLMLLKGYNHSVPIVPQTFIQAGVRINRAQ